MASTLQVPLSRAGIATAPQPRVNPNDAAATVARGGQAAARGLGQIGDTLAGAGAAGTREAHEEHERLANLQRQANVTRLTGDLTQALTQRLEDAKTQATDGAPGFTQNYGTIVREESTRLLDSIQDEETKAVATVAFQDVANTMGGAAAKFEWTERQRYMIDTLDVQSRTLSNAVYSNPDLLDSFLDQGMRRIASMPLPPDLAREATTTLHQSIAGAYALHELDRDPARLLADLGGPRNAGPRSAAPGTADDVWQRMLQAESGGRQLRDDGTPVTSPAGAIGIAQVMPATAPEAAALAGLEWDETRYRTDPTYNAALGRAYFDKQVETFGDLRLAAAAYNAGPGRVREHIRNGRPLPAETRAYVSKVFGGAPQESAPPDLSQHPVYRHLTPNQFSSFLTQAESRVRDRGADLRATLKRRYENEIASVLMGVPVTEAGKTKDEEFYAVYAPEVAAEKIEQRDDYYRLGAMISDLVTMTPAEMMAAHDAFVVQAGDDVEHQATLLDRFDQALARVMKLREDPALFAQQQSEAVQQAWAAVDQAQGADQWEAIAQAAALSVQWQEDHGFTEGERRALPADVAQRWWDSHQTADERARFVEVLAGTLDDRAFAATIEHLGGKTAIPEMRQVAMLMDQPRIARSVLRGHAALASGVKLAPPTGGTDWTEAMASKLGAAGLMLGDIIPGRAGHTRADVEGAILGRYADLMAMKGTPGGEYNEATLNQAVLDVTGGVLKGTPMGTFGANGRQIFAPIPGMTQDQMDDVMDGLTDADLAGARDLAGRHLTAAQFRKWGELVDAGDGQYAIMFNGDLYNGGLVLGADGQPFILDLRARAEAVMGPQAASAGAIPPTPPGGRFPTGRTL